MSTYVRGGVVAVVVAVAVAVLALSMRCGFAATVHHVGSGTCDADPSWSSTSKCDFNAWSQKQDFVVGDYIVFTFTYGDSDVALVRKVDYDYCTTYRAMPIYSMNNWTVSPVTLILPGADTFYFISNLKSTDCDTNLKMAITIRPQAGSAAPPASNSPPSPAAIPIFINLIVPYPAPAADHHKSSIKAPLVAGILGFIFLAAKLALITHCTKKWRAKKIKEQETQRIRQENYHSTSAVFEK